MPCKLLIIGHDGLDIRFLNPERDQTVFDLAKSGQLLTMRSYYKQTVPSWTSIYTGLRKEEHGLTGDWVNWLKRKQSNLKYYWNCFNDQGYSIGLFCMPLTYPPAKLNGWVVSGFPSPFFNRGITYPTGLERFLTDYKGDIVDYIQINMCKTRSEALDYAECEMFVKLGRDKVIKETIDAKMATLDKIFSRYNTDVLSVGFTFVDHTFHLDGGLALLFERKQLEEKPKSDNHIIDQRITKENERQFLIALKTSYRFVDYSIAETLKIAQPQRVVIVSDHGLGFGGHSSNGVLLVNGKKIAERDYGEWEVFDVIVTMMEK